MKKTILYIIGLQILIMVFAYEIYLNLKELKQKPTIPQKNVQEASSEPIYSGIKP